MVCAFSFFYYNDLTTGQITVKKKTKFKGKRSKRLRFISFVHVKIINWFGFSNMEISSLKSFFFRTFIARFFFVLYSNGADDLPSTIFISFYQPHVYTNFQWKPSTKWKNVTAWHEHIKCVIKLKNFLLRPFFSYSLPLFLTFSNNRKSLFLFPSKKKFDYEVQTMDQWTFSLNTLTHV